MFTAVISHPAFALLLNRTAPFRSQGKQASAAFRGHLNFVFSVDFNPRGNMIASGSFDESLRLWDVRSGRAIRTIPAHSEPITSVQFNGDGSVVATGSYDGLM